MSDLLEREQLLAALDDLAAGGGRLVFVGGEAGVGKTALVRAYGGRTSARVLQGSCENLATPVPLGPFSDLAAQTGGRLAEVMGSGGDPRAVARALVEEMATPVVVVLEDVHWADEATLDALRVLGRRVDQSRGLVLATFRDDEAVGDHPLRVVLGELASASGVSRVTVPRLTAQAVNELAAPPASTGRRCTGSPAATPSTSPRSSRATPSRCPSPSATPFSPAQPRSGPGASSSRRRGARPRPGRGLAPGGRRVRRARPARRLSRIGHAPRTRATRSRSGTSSRGSRSKAPSRPVPRGPRPTTRANPAELTARELDVLRLVVAGKRNAEIADVLVLSRRTVDHHVSAILRKLDVRSRGEATVAARERGLLDRD